MYELVDTLIVEIEQLALLLEEVVIAKQLANLEYVKTRAKQAQQLAGDARKVCPRVIGSA